MQRVAVADVRQAGLDAGRILAAGEGVEVQSLLDRRKSRLGRILELLFGGHATHRYARP